MMTFLLMVRLIPGASEGAGPEPPAVNGIGYYWRKRRRKR